MIGSPHVAPQTDGIILYMPSSFFLAADDADYQAKVLVVDDEPDMADSIRLMLERYGHQVVVETDSTRALQLAAAEQPDLVLTDLCMPDLDGLELMERLRASNMNMPVIIITGYASTDAASRVKASGAADYFSKPFSPDELRRRVEKVLASS